MSHPPDVSEERPVTRSIRRVELEENGFCIVPDVLDRSAVKELITVTDRVVDDQGAGHGTRQRTTGSMVPITSDPLYADLITRPSAWAALAELGFDDATFSDGWVISKPGGGPRLFWHYDWFTWEDEASYGATPLQVSLMYYLNDTTVENGCLRVVPGSHRTHNPLHDLLSRPRAELTRSEHDDWPEFADRPDEVDVPVRAGDLLITDARLLHAGHANRTNERRRLITLWYQPSLATMPERMQAQMALKAQKPPDSWPAASREKLNAVLTRYDGSAEPYERSLYRRQLTKASIPRPTVE